MQQICWLLTFLIPMFGTSLNLILLHVSSLVFRVLPSSTWCFRPFEGDAWILKLLLSERHFMILFYVVVSNQARQPLRNCVPIQSMPELRAQSFDNVSKIPFKHRAITFVVFNHSSAAFKRFTKALQYQFTYMARFGARINAFLLALTPLPDVVFREFL